MITVCQILYICTTSSKTFNLPTLSVTSEKNVCCVNMVNSILHCRIAHDPIWCLRAHILTCFCTSCLASEGLPVVSCLKFPTMYINHLRVPHSFYKENINTTCMKGYSTVQSLLWLTCTFGSFATLTVKCDMWMCMIFTSVVYEILLVFLCIVWHFLFLCVCMLFSSFNEEFKERIKGALRNLWLQNYNKLKWVAL